METLEQRVNAQYNQSLREVLLGFAEQSFTKKEVAKELGCSIWNIRKLADRHGVHFVHPRTPKPAQPISHSKEFTSPSLNKVNFLSRQWQKGTECQ